jgi:plastocyanin
MFLVALIPFTVACGDGADHGGHTTPDAATADQTSPIDTPATDQPVPNDTPVVTDASNDSGVAVPLLNDCRAADYEDRGAGVDTDRVVRPRGTTGYTPRCVIIQAGQSVTFEMNFATHPLVPGVPHGSTSGATVPNPIARQNSGMTHTVAFPNAGYYPFYCNTHGHVGMAGVVRVMP